MKKTFVIIIILVFSEVLRAQKIEPFAAAEFYKSNHLTIQYVNQKDYFNLGDMSLLYGMRFNPFNNIVEFSISAQTFMDVLRVDRYKPRTAFYNISAGYQFKNVFIKIEHQCIHPIRNPKFELSKDLFGGYTKIGVYWNYNKY